MKVIHIELPHKRCESVVTIVSGEDEFLKFFLVEDSDSFELSVPLYDFGVFLGLS